MEPEQFTAIVDEATGIDPPAAAAALVFKFSHRSAVLALDSTHACFIFPLGGYCIYLDRNHPEWKKELLQFLDETFLITDLYVAGSELPVSWTNGNVYLNYRDDMLKYACCDCKKRIQKGIPSDKIACCITKGFLTWKKMLQKSVYGMIHSIHQSVDDIQRPPNEQVPSTVEG